MDLFARSLQAEPDETIIEIGASPLRRLLGAGALALICAILLWNGYQNFIKSGSGLLLMLFALAGYYAAWRFWQSSSIRLVLTPTELRDSRGRLVANIADIVALQRDAFGIIKPTNGFVIATREKQPAAFIPGIWWRLGNRIGIGGLTGSGEGKAMAELLQELLRRRDDV